MIDLVINMLPMLAILAIFFTTMNFVQKRQRQVQKEHLEALNRQSAALERIATVLESNAK